MMLDGFYEGWLLQTVGNVKLVVGSHFLLNAFSTISKVKGHDKGKKNHESVEQEISKGIEQHVPSTYSAVPVLS